MNCTEPLISNSLSFSALCTSFFSSLSKMNSFMPLRLMGLLTPFSVVGKVNHTTG